ncbi:MAG TPA: hypothetical protein VF366_07020 [Dehalococcoidia bacterium]
MAVRTKEDATRVLSEASDDKRFLFVTMDVWPATCSDWSTACHTCRRSRIDIM